jgi:hypothetical protein
MSTRLDSFIYRSPPETLPQGTVGAYIKLETIPANVREAPFYSPRTPEFRAQVRQVVQGDYKGEFIIMRPSAWSSCDSLPEDGQVGFMIGFPQSTEDGVLVVDPVRVGDLADGKVDYSVPKATNSAERPVRETPSSNAVHNIVPWSVVFVLVAGISAFFALKRVRNE